MSGYDELKAATEALRAARQWVREPFAGSANIAVYVNDAPVGPPKQFHAAMGRVVMRERPDLYREALALMEADRASAEMKAKGELAELVAQGRADVAPGVCDE